MSSRRKLKCKVKLLIIFDNLKVDEFNSSTYLWLHTLFRIRINRVLVFSSKTIIYKQYN